MDRFRYESIISKIRLLELKIERIKLEKDYMYIIKPLMFSRRRNKVWTKKYNELLDEEKKSAELLEDALRELEKMF